jgi:hypothetical protein
LLVGIVELGCGLSREKGIELGISFTHFLLQERGTKVLSI